MPETAAGVQLVVAISSRALFDFEEENELFDPRDDRPYIELQLARLDQLAKPGVAFRLVRKLLGFNADGVRRVEVAILSRNDNVSGLRVMKSVEGERACHRARGLHQGTRAVGVPAPAQRKPLPLAQSARRARCARGGFPRR
jgi:5'-nucleotidase